MMSSMWLPLCDRPHGKLAVTWSTAPRSPEFRMCFASVYDGIHRLAVLMAKATPFSRHASTIASASARLIAIGFSAQMPLAPEPATSCTMRALIDAVVVTLTMSGRSFSSISR